MVQADACHDDVDRPGRDVPLELHRLISGPRRSLRIDPDRAATRLGLPALLGPAGRQATARWCFARLAEPGDDAEGGWLHRRRDEWESSGQSWPDAVRSWAQQDPMHSGGQILTGLDACFERESLVRGPFFFADLADTTEADEQAAIDAGQIQATGIRYTGRPRKP